MEQLETTTEETKYNMPEKRFYIPGNLWATGVATWKDGAYICAYTKQTLEQLRQQHPTMVLLSFDAVEKAIEESAITSVIEISEEKYNEFLNVLPPLDWAGGEGHCTFKLRAMYVGNITSIYVRYHVGECRYKYFTFRNRVTIKHIEILNLVRKYIYN
ncbi:hypothetical protein [Yersinia bercovieri]|uniref:hypothetical protein n=1 Tax=Yersinia bercovieri TaxID=634 RepID=UPI000519C831|nr:hypothetical protein [Yersinia bercovieri]QKJ09195.1 hypothetical protein HRK25_19830 [Yersinia bercovieri ATCC 43970]